MGYICVQKVKFWTNMFIGNGVAWVDISFQNVIPEICDVNKVIPFQNVLLGLVQIWVKSYTVGLNILFL